MNYNKIKNIIEIVLLVLAILLLNMISITNFIAFFILAIISTIPMVIMTLKYKEKIAILSGMIIFIVFILLFPIWEAIIKEIAIVIPGIGIGYCIKHKHNLKDTMLAGMIMYVIAFIISNLIVKYFLGINLINDLYINGVYRFFEAFNVNNDLSELVLSIQNMNMEDYLNKILEFEAWWILIFLYEVFIFAAFIGGQNINILFSLIPGVIALTALVVSFIITKTSQVLIKNKVSDNIEKFSSFKLPFGYGILFILGQLILSATDLRYGIAGFGTAMLLNLMLILNLGFMVQGLALVDYYVIKVGINNNFRILIYFAVCILTFPISILIVMALIFMGIVEYLFDFRKLKVK